MRRVFTVHGMADSGNCYKVKLLLEQLGLPYRWNEVSAARGETRMPGFLALNPNGKVPVLALEDGTALAESNAILWYLAEDTPLAPDSRLARARALQWMFFEQYSHEPYIAVVRHWIAHLGKTPETEPQLPMRIERGHHALGVMETRLKDQAWFAGSDYSIADIALYAYTHVAHEGGFDLTPYPGIRAWLKRVVGQPGHIRITD